MKNLEKFRNIAQRHETQSEATKNWVLNSEVNFDTAITLTFSKYVKDHIEAERMFGLFMRYLNERCYRKRKEMRINVFAVQEGLWYQRNHYHCAMQRPIHLDAEEFSRRVRKVWQKVSRDDEVIIEIKEMYSNGWVGYMTKEITQKNSTNISEHCNF